MKYRRGFTLRFMVLAGIMLSIVMAGGCAQIRKATYPQDFVYLSRTDVSNTMHQIAGHMAALDSLLEDISPDADTQRVARDMLQHLELMNQLAGALGQGATGTNHLLIDAHLGDFVSALDSTRVTLNASPPRFYEVGRLVGSCNACHRFR